MYIRSVTKVKLQESPRPQLEFYWLNHIEFNLTCITRTNAISQSRLKVESTSITKVQSRFTFVWRHWGAYWLCQIVSSWFFSVHVPNALCFSFLVLDNVCLLMSKNPLVYKQIFVVNRPFCLFLKFTELTHYNVEFVRISICRNSSWAAASFIHQWARRPAPLMLGKLSLQVAEPRW